MRWRFITPNKPIRANEDFLNGLTKDHVLDSKLDGWRVEICNINGVLQFISRHNKKLNIPPKLALKFSSLPYGMGLDAEWLNSSRIKSINTEFGLKLPTIDNIVVFDVRWVDYKFQASVPLLDRRNNPYYQDLPEESLDGLLQSTNQVFKAISTTGNKAKQFYKKQTKRMISEGIVIKKSDSKLNDSWYSVKYRK